MNEQIKHYIDRYPEDIVRMYYNLRSLIFDCASSEPREMLWANLPSYYVGESFIRLIPFKDHINIEARTISGHNEELRNYKITPKGMLQIYLRQDIPYDALRQIFIEALT